MCNIGDLGTTQTIFSVPLVCRAKTQPLAYILNPSVIFPYAFLAPPVPGLHPEATWTLLEPILPLHHRCPHLSPVHALQEPSPPGSL